MCCTDELKVNARPAVGPSSNDIAATTSAQRNRNVVMPSPPSG